MVDGVEARSPASAAVLAAHAVRAVVVAKSKVVAAVDTSLPNSAGVLLPYEPSDPRDVTSIPSRTLLVRRIPLLPWGQSWWSYIERHLWCWAEDEVDDAVASVRTLLV